MSRVFIQKPYQQLATDFMLSTPRCALFGGMGIGKTVSALTVADILFLTGNDSPILALAPLRVARETWPKEVKKWDHLKHLEVSPIVGSPAQRRSALRKPAHIYTTNYEQLPWLVESFGNRAWPFRVVFADESPRLKGYRTKQGGQRAHALAQVARHTDRWINLTGTPAANGLKDLWGQFWFLDFGQRLGWTYEGFKERWFRNDHDGYGIKPVRYAEREIYAAISDITLSIRSEDWFDVEKPIERKVPVTLPPAARAQYKQLENEMFTKLACGTEVEAFNAASLTNKCRQFTNGAVYTEHPAWASVHDAKLEALDSIVQEASGASLLVAYEFVSDKARILSRFGKNAADISKPEGMKAFMNGHVQLGVAHPQSMGHGIDGLQDVCNMLVYFGYGWNLEHHQQILERIGPVRQEQSGHKRSVWVWSIVAEDTIDETLIERHASKREVQDLLLEAMTRRKH